MFKIIESKKKQSIREMKQEYPHSKLLIRLDSELDEEGYLLAISTDKASSGQLGDYMQMLPDSILRISGCYKEDDFIGLQHVTRIE